MSGNVTGHSTSNESIDPATPARELATYPSQLYVQFAEIDLPDTPANNRIIRPVTRRWTRSWAPVEFNHDPDERETEPEQEDGEGDLDAKSQQSEIAFRSNDTNVSGTVASQQRRDWNGKRTRLLTFGTSSDASKHFTVSHVKSEDVHSPFRATNMARHNHNNAEQARPAPAAPTAPSTSQTPASVGPSGNRRSHITPQPHRAMQSQASPLARGLPRDASGHGNNARVTESVRNGKRRVEIDLLSDDEDEVLTPSRRASNTAGQRSEQPRRMTSSSSTGVTPDKKTASNPPEARTVKRLSQASGLERRLFTTAPQATFVNIPAAAFRQPQAQNFSPQHQVTPAQTQIDRSRSTQAHPNPMQADGPLSQQLPANNSPFTHDGSRNAPRYSSPGLFVNQLNDRRTPAATMERSFPSDQARDMNDQIEQHGLPFPRQAQPAPGYPIGARTDNSFLSGAADPSLMPGSGPPNWVRPDDGTMSQAERVQGQTNYQPGVSMNRRHFEESDDENPPATYSRFKNQMQMQDEPTKHGIQPSNAYSDSAMRSQLATTRPTAHSTPTPSQAQDGKIVPKATGMDFQSQPAFQSNMDFMAATQKRSENPFAGMSVEHLHNRPRGPGYAANPSEYQHEERHNQGARPSHPEMKKGINRFDEQHIEKGARFPAAEIGDEVSEENVQLYQHAEDYDDGDEEYTPTRDKGKGKQRAWGQNWKIPKNETVSKKPFRLVTLRIPTKAFHLFQPPKDPSVPMGVDFLSQMPMEVRQRIYGHLLKANTSIAVMHGWSQVYRRQLLDLHVSILGVNKKHNIGASAVLYGENVFRYILRDDGNMVEFEAGKKKDERMLPLKKQIDNLRYLEVEIEPNRIDLAAFLAFYATLEILVKHKATKLFRLTIDLSPRIQKGIPNKKGESKDWISQRVWFTKAQGITDLLKQLKARFVYFDIHLEENNHSQATSLRTIVDMRPEISDKEVSAELMKHSDQLKASRPLEARRALARDSIEERLEAEAYKKLDMMNTRLEQAVLKGAPHMLHRGWFTELKTERQQRKPIQGGEFAVDDE